MKEKRRNGGGSSLLLGTVVNALLIVAGTMIGRMFRNLPEHVHRTIMHGIGLVVVLIGLSMALKTEKVLSVLISMAVGGAHWEVRSHWKNG